MINRLLSALTPKQAAAVAFVSAFITIIGGLALAFYFTHRNRKGETKCVH